MIPDGYAAAIHAWATSPEISDNERAARSQSLLAERDALITGVTSGGKSIRELSQASLNGKSFQWDTGVSKAEKLTVISDVLTRLGLVAPAAAAVTTTHADFSCLQR